MKEKEGERPKEVVLVQIFRISCVSGSPYFFNIFSFLGGPLSAVQFGRSSSLFLFFPFSFYYFISGRSITSGAVLAGRRSHFGLVGSLAPALEEQGGGDDGAGGEHDVVDRRHHRRVECVEGLRGKE
jgi:hypothetical protein